jgi:UDP-glucose 4-epimerase
MKTDRSLVTGGAGFIGSHVAETLVARGHRVTVLDDLSGGFRDNVPAGAEFVQGSVTDHATVDRLFRAGEFDFVFHLAAYAAEGLSHFIKRFNYTNNLIGSVNLINAAVNVGSVRCFVFTSSIAVYGPNQLPMTEDLTPAPEDPYGIAKYAVELDLQQAQAMFGLPFVVFRPHNVYGERQNIGDRYRNVVGIFINQALRGEPFTIFGDGEQTRAFSHISDVAPIIARSVELPSAFNEVFNVGADVPCSVNDVARAVANAMDVPLRVTRLEPRHEVVHAYSSHAKVRKHFEGLPAALPLDEGIARMCAWARRHGARTSQPFAAVEVMRNMPPAWRAAVAPGPAEDR